MLVWSVGAFFGCLLWVSRYGWLMSIVRKMKQDDSYGPAIFIEVWFYCVGLIWVVFLIGGVVGMFWELVDVSS